MALVAEKWPLTGRTAELRRVAELLRSGASAVVVAGPPGVGKTRLATECLAVAANGGFDVARVTGTQAAASLPFGAFAPLIPELGLAGDRGDLLRQVARAVTERGGRKRVALLVDDAHLLDEASAALTYQLATNEDTFVLATVRAAEPASDAVVALWKDGVAERLDLPPLGRTDVEALLATALGGAVDGATAHEFFDHSDGNVLFLRELVLAAREAGVLRFEGGLWSLRGRLPASARLVELIEARLGGLDQGDRDMLDVLALGEPLGVEVFADSDREVRLQALERRRLVQVEEHRRRLSVRLAHPLYGDVLRARLSPLRARGLSRALADQVERTGARRAEDILRVATWRLTAGGEVHADLMLAAAKIALQRCDYQLAERLARAAVQVGGGFDVAVLAAQVAGFQGRVVEAEAELAALAARAAHDAERGLVAVTRMDNLQYGPDHSAEALRVGEQVEAAIRDRYWLHEIAARRASILGRTQGPRAVVDAAEPIRREGRGRAYVVASYLAAHGLARMGCVAAALEAVREGHEADVALRGPPLQWSPETCSALACEAFVHAGQLEEGERLATAAYRRAVADRATESQAIHAWQLGQLFLARGHIGTAARYGREAAALFRELGRLPFLAYALAPLATALAIGGHVEEAVAAVAEAQDLDMPPKSLWAVDALVARAWTAVAEDDVDLARCVLKDAVALGDKTGDLVGQTAALHDLARLGFGKEVAGQLAVVARGIQGELPPARVFHVEGLARGDGTMLEQASTHFEALGTELLAAEAAADAAVAYRRAGDPRKAAGVERRAQGLAARCEGARTPALTAVRVRATLTARELEIARLASAGVPNKEIAIRLCLSLHTVENKLHFAYEKLGVEGRSELAQALEGY